MLHEVFKLTRPLFVFDCETTGVDTENDRIIELGFQMFTANGMEKEWCGRFNPGVLIVEDVSKVHGITNADVANAPTFASAAQNIANGFTDCDFAGKNVRFDLKILDAEIRRAGVTWSYADAKIIDAERLEQLGEPRSLSDLYRKHVTMTCPGCDGIDDFSGRPCDSCGGRKRVPAVLLDAHEAMADVRATAEVILAQMKKYQFTSSVADLHELQWPGQIGRAHV